VITWRAAEAPATRFSVWGLAGGPSSSGASMLTPARLGASLHSVGSLLVAPASSRRRLPNAIQTTQCFVRLVVDVGLAAAKRDRVHVPVRVLPEGASVVQMSERRSQRRNAGLVAAAVANEARRSSRRITCCLPAYRHTGRARAPRPQGRLEQRGLRSSPPLRRRRA
jgi:hypothetical protein